MMLPAVVALADELERRLTAHRIALTMGGEPTYVPEDCSGAEWNITAVGPTKLRYANALARALIADVVPGAIAMFSPGKLYPGETNPRWVLNLLWSQEGTPLAPAPTRGRKPTGTALSAMKDIVASRLGLPADRWLRALDPLSPHRPIWVLPLDHHADRGGWHTDLWNVGQRARRLRLLVADGPSGLRLPLGQLAPDALRRALVLELRDGAVTCFLPPLLHAPFHELLEILTAELSARGFGGTDRHHLEGYLPVDLDPRWGRLGLTADPGVLEVNLPPCETWHEYERWLRVLESAATKVGLRSWKMDAFRGVQTGTGGGNHLLFGGPSLEANPFFPRPAWVASILRYFQAHPCLAYLFTGSYVGPSSQAPRPDESGRGLYDLELAYALLASQAKGDHRELIGETLRHLHTDMSGNTHRSEISFDKFWDIGGVVRAGLIEFRAIETMPRCEWMSLTALLWRAILLHALEIPATGPLAAVDAELHDRYFLPSNLWMDLESIMSDLRAIGLDFGKSARQMFREIWAWRFPTLLEADGVIVRRACESWPLLCETPLEGGSTSRFVDTSMDRLEFSVAAELAPGVAVSIEGRPARLLNLADGFVGFGLRYRRSALYPSLHPGIPPQLPLHVEIRTGSHAKSFLLAADRPEFVAVEPADPRPVHEPCRGASDELLTYDLRL
jgi:uncharacterized protein (DUF2126 family)